MSGGLVVVGQCVSNFGLDSGSSLSDVQYINRIKVRLLNPVGIIN
jgi:hypothetical protein